MPKARAKSPERYATHLGSLYVPARDMRPRSDSFGEAKQTLPDLNINRWSHSTSSSTSAIDSDISRKGASGLARPISINASRAASSVLPLSPLGIYLSPEIDSFASANRSPQPSPRRHQPPRINLPLQILDASHIRRERSPNTPSTITLTPSLPQGSPAALRGNDYFGETWARSRSGGKTAEAVKGVAIHYITTSPSGEIHHEKSRLETNTRTGIQTDDVASQDVLQGRRRDRSANSSADTGVGSSASSLRSEPGRSRNHRSPAQKSMLSNALAKANTAVLFDNAQNIEGAIEAYAEACELLQQVMVRSSDIDDRKKLSAIRSTYSNRIAELHDLDNSFASMIMNKALPDDPPSDDSPVGNDTTFYRDDLMSPGLGVAETLEEVYIPLRQESLLPQIFGGESFIQNQSAPPQRTAPNTQNLAVPMDAQYMPPPLSPGRLGPSTLEDEISALVETQASSEPIVAGQHAHGRRSESISWLNTFDDSASSAPSSRLPSIDHGTMEGFSLADDIEAEFDAALNAAVNAAYDEETTHEDTPRQEAAGEGDIDHEFFANNRDENGLSSPTTRSLTHVLEPAGLEKREIELTREYLDSDAEEEERLLDDVTRGFAFGDFHFDKHSKSALPRQSDSSTFSGRTWASSIPSTTTTNATTLSTLAEALETASQEASAMDMQAIAKGSLPSPPPPIPPPKVDLPSQAIPSQSAARPTSFENSIGSALRDRRLSGHSPKQLKIETFARRPTTTSSTKNSRILQRLPTFQVPNVVEPNQLLQSAPPTQSLFGPSSTSTVATQPITPMTSINSGDSINSESPATPALTQGDSQISIDDSGVPASPRMSKGMPTAQSVSKKNSSSTSLRMKNLSVGASDNAESPITPGSGMSTSDARKGLPPVPTPVMTSFNFSGSSAGGMHLFDDHIGTPASPCSPKTPNAVVSNTAPTPLEPCPESFLLRPFWLMRCLYQTISHPRGGYVSTKLFIPRDIWRVKNVKLKVVDDKVSQCDLLTAALQKLAKVDNLDANAVLQELQSFENVLEQVRGALQKKLGGEVGLSSSSNVFRTGAGISESADALPNRSVNTTSSSSKFASTFRKLRSKSSTPTINSGSGGGILKENDASSIGFTMSTLPMTSSSSVPSSRAMHMQRSRAPPPTPTQLTNIPQPHAMYMASLARLFDAVQVLDSIARQVVDPGLKCSSETLVGLEFSIRNAAEFFAFYVVRFVMADIGLLVDKFLKRGSEWVLA